MKPAPFEYHAPSSVGEAVGLLAELGDEAKVLAGGQSLIPMLALRLAVFEHLVDIGRIDELVGIERRDDALWIGARDHARRRSRSARRWPRRCRCSRRRPRSSATSRSATAGTLGGSIAHADPAAEYPAVALALDASIEVASPSAVAGPSRRATSSTGLWSTSMQPDELLVGVHVPGVERAERLRGRGVRPPPRRLRDRRCSGRRGARRRRPHRAVRHRPDRAGLDPGARRRGRGRR